jgi:hypothetical protein
VSTQAAILNCCEHLAEVPTAILLLTAKFLEKCISFAAGLVDLPIL